ncbi:hypothetical protein HF313_16325 [Massilia atriviolacea]
MVTIHDNERYWYQCAQKGMPLQLTNRHGKLAWAIVSETWGEASRLFANLACVRNDLTTAV